MINLQEVCKTYPPATKAVDHLTLTVNEGEILGLTGTSGSGKTTTLKMINRLVEPTSGHIVVDGRDILDQDPVELRRSIGYVIQHVGLFPHYTIRQNLSTVPRLKEWPEEKIEQRCSELMEMVGLSSREYLHKMPHQLSGGEQQRIGLARALAADPPIVLLDEPFGALDPITRSEIHRQFKNLQQKIQKTMVMVTHDITEAFELCDRIALLDEGELQQAGSPRELLFQPANEFTKAFFDPNRFMLEMLTLTIGECVEELEPTDKSDEAVTFSPDTKFLTVFSEMEKKMTGDLMIAVEGKRETAYYHADELLEAFYQAKQKLHQAET